MGLEGVARLETTGADRLSEETSGLRGPGGGHRLETSMERRSVRRICCLGLEGAARLETKSCFTFVMVTSRCVGLEGAARLETAMS